jgi:hypothetical protein
MALARERDAEAFAWRVDDDQDTRPAGIRVAGAGDEPADLETSMQLIVENGVHIVARLEPFRLTPGQEKLIHFTAAVVQRIEDFDASPGGNRLGNAETHNRILCSNVEKE